MLHLSTCCLAWNDCRVNRYVFQGTLRPVDFITSVAHVITCTVNGVCVSTSLRRARSHIAHALFPNDYRMLSCFPRNHLEMFSVFVSWTSNLLPYFTFFSTLLCSFIAQLCCLNIVFDEEFRLLGHIACVSLLRTFPVVCMIGCRITRHLEKISKTIYNNILTLLIEQVAMFQVCFKYEVFSISY